MGFWRAWERSWRGQPYSYVDYEAVREAAEEGFGQGYQAAREQYDDDDWDDSSETESPYLNQQYLRSLDEQINQIRRDFPKTKFKLATEGWTFEEICEKFHFILSIETKELLKAKKAAGINAGEKIDDQILIEDILSLDPSIENDAVFWDKGKGDPTDSEYEKHMLRINSRMRRTGLDLGREVRAQWTTDGRCVVTHL